MTKIAFAMMAVLVAGAVQAETVTPPAKITDRRSPDFVRCVSTLETGSLVKRHKTCKTNAEWQKSESDQRNNADRFINDTRRALTTVGN